MIYHRLLIVTSLLIVLLYSGYGLYASVAVFAITVTTTYICYTLNTQLRLERIFKFLVFPQIGASKSFLKDNPFADQTDFHIERPHDGLKHFPKPIEKIIRKFLDSIIRDFVRSWYIYLGPEDNDFIEETKFALEYAVTGIAMQLESVDLPNAVANLIRMFQRHIKVFDDYRNIVQTKYPGISDADFSDCITELYEAGIIKHIATHSKGSELDYLKTLLDILLYKFLPKAAFSCEGGRFLLREVLAVQLLEPLIKQFTEAHFVNQIIIDILEPSVPLPVVIKMYEDAMTEINLENDDLPLDTLEFDASDNDTNYESSPEDIKCLSGSQTVSSSKASFSRDLNTLEHLNTRDELLRFDNLDRSRTSAPVYGSKSARDHENSKHNRLKKIRVPSFSVTNLESQENKVNQDVMIVDSGSVPKRNASLTDELCSTISDEQNLPNVESWNDCPPSNADVFRKISFNEMPRNQDKLSEQLKAKVKQISLPTSCIDSCGFQKRQQHRLSQDTIVEGSVTMEFSKKQPKVPKQEDVAVRTNLVESEVEDQIVKVHSSGTNGAFYEVAPACPTCIEMTLLASPFENDKAQLVFSPAEHKKVEHKKVEQHECGLGEEHYFNAETEHEILNLDTLDTESFESCTDDINDLSVGYSSGTLLASGESVQSLCSDDDTGKGSDSYDVVSSFSDASNNTDSSLMSINFEDIEKVQDINGDDSPKRRNIHRTLSVTTFKTAIESSIVSQEVETPVQKYKSRPKKDLPYDKIFRFFKSSYIGEKQRNLSSNEGILKKRNRRRKGKRNDTQHANKLLSSVTDGIPVTETSSISTSLTKFNSLPDSSVPTNGNWNRRDSFIGSFIEEVGLEAEEDEQYLDEFEDAPSQIYASSLHSAIPLDPLSQVIAVTEKDLLVEATSIKSYESTDVKKNIPNEATVIPIFEGEVIMPHPSKIPAKWLYPIQMISIPTTEVAYEKGWEPGINKYTLYSVHYDIRIWPDLYQKQILDQEHRLETEKRDTIPVIREIKRRYREFLFLHNRLTHGHLSKHMKGILRPNRRYAMPFGRMEPDVIEGRRKILETYLVSLVSRPELCNSREFKDFLGSEGSDDPSDNKVKKVSQKKIYKQKVNNVLTSSNSAENFNVTKEQEKFHPVVNNSQYFIHGYEIPRMFGYCSKDDLKRHDMLCMNYFVEKYFGIQSVIGRKPAFSVASFEPIQKPMVYIPNELIEGRQPVLGERTAGDGAEMPDDATKEKQRAVSFDSSVKTHDGKMFDDRNNCIKIAAKFSEEIAAQLQKEKESLAFQIAHEKHLYESSWPLTDAVLSIVSQALKSYDSWLTYERVQQAVLFSLGGIIEWLINRELNEVIMIEKWYKYLKDLYHVVWDKQEKLKEKEPEPSEEEKIKVKEEALQRIMEIIPKFVMMSVGPQNYRKCCENLLHTVQYSRINRHVLYAALEIILLELIPELQVDFEGYVHASKANSQPS